MKLLYSVISLVFICILAACKGNPSKNLPTGYDTASATGSAAISATTLQNPEVKETEDVAQKVLGMIDRNLIPQRFTDQELANAINEKRTFDEYTSPLKISVLKGDGGIYNIIYVNCYPLLNEEDGYFVLYYTEAGVDGAVLDFIKTYIYRNGVIAEVENPIKAPAFDEFFKGVEIPAEINAEYRMLKRDYGKGEGGLRGLDLRFAAQDDCILELRPSYIASDAIWELAKPVCYQFNGTTFEAMR